jgi:N-acetylglutamate synthase-like GNAT family acetyltransferase
LGTDFHAYIAENEGEIIASVFLVIQELPANTNFITGKIGNILNVYTRPEYRMKGIAKQLLNNMIGEARTKNLSYLELLATDEGYPVYKKLGFADKKFTCTPMKLELN